MPNLTRKKRGQLTLLPHQLSNFTHFARQTCQGVGVCVFSSRRPSAPMRNYSNSKLCGIRGWRRCRVAASTPARYYTCIAAKGGRVSRGRMIMCCVVRAAGGGHPRIMWSMGSTRVLSTCGNAVVLFPADVMH